MVQLAQCALPVNEVGGSQLVEGLQGQRCGAVQINPNFWAPAKLPLVHENGQRLLSW